MQFLNLFRFRGFRKAKHSATILPSDWPSYLHSKCTTPTCWFPNPPQAAAGTYNCQGRPNGCYCTGTYQVTSAMATSTTKNHENAMYLEKIKAKKAGEVGRQKDDLKKKGSKLSIFKTDSQKTLKAAIRKQEYLNKKMLPPIPGLSQRCVNRTRFVPQPPAQVDVRDALEPLYPQVVLHYYFPQDQLSAPPVLGSSNLSHSYKPAPTSSRPFVPQRRPPSGNCSSYPLYGSSLPHQISNQNQKRPRYHELPYNHRR